MKKPSFSLTALLHNRRFIAINALLRRLRLSLTTL